MKKRFAVILAAVMLLCPFSAVPALAMGFNGVKETDPLRFGKDYSVTFNKSELSYREYTVEVPQNGVMTVYAQKSYINRSKINVMQYELDGVYSVENPTTAAEDVFVYPFAVCAGRHTLKIGPDSIFMSYGETYTFDFRVDFAPDTLSIDLNHSGYSAPVGPPCYGYLYNRKMTVPKETAYFEAIADTTYRITYSPDNLLYDLKDGEKTSVAFTKERNPDGTAAMVFTAGYTETYALLVKDTFRSFSNSVPFSLTIEPVAQSGQHVHVVKEGDITCNRDGTHSGVCSYCGRQATVPCTYCEKIRLPTATAPGSSSYTCAYCGYQKKDTVIADESSSDARMMGDIDNDGKVTSADARTVLRASVLLEHLTAEQLVYADYDYSAAVESSDARSVLRCSVGLEKTVRHDFKTTVRYGPKCTAVGRAENICSMCGKTNPMEIPPLGHDFKEGDTITQPTCEKNGLRYGVCSRCSTKEAVRVPALGHAAVAATCSRPSYCSRCKEMLGMPKKHTAYGGTCSSCGQYIPRVLKDVEIYIIRTTINSAGGAELAIGFGNNSAKTIKYIHFYLAPYNAVGDPVYCRITGNGESDAYVTGPIAPGETTHIYDGHDTAVYRWDPLWYNNSIRTAQLNSIRIEYTDGTSVSYYGSDARAAIIGYWNEKIPKN